MKILSVIVAYNPDIELIRKNLRSFIPYVSKVIIWDNTTAFYLKKEDLDIEYRDKIILLQEGENIGISRALNKSLEYAKNQGIDYDFLLTMDQDSIFKSFDSFLEHIRSIDNIENSIFAPRISHSIDSRNLQFENTYKESWGLITSGMLVPKSVIGLLKGYNEEFFVDCVDVDFVLRARSKGIKSYILNSAVLLQRFGDIEYQNFGPLKFRIYNYSTDRLYNIYRNHLMLIKRYPKEKDFAKIFYKTWLWRRPIRILLGEKHKFSKLKTIFKAISSTL